MSIDLHGMTEEQRDQILLDFVEQALPAEDLAAIGRHIQGCPACQLAVDQLQHYQTHIAPLLLHADSEPAPELLQKLKASVAQAAAQQTTPAGGLTAGKPESNTRTSHWRTWQLALRPSRQLAIAAAAVVILALSWTLVDQILLVPTARDPQRPAAENALNAVAPDVVDEAASAAEKGVDTAGDSAAAGEETTPAAGPARLMMAEAAPAWLEALNTDLPLPLIDTSHPDQVVTVLDVVPEAQAAVWLDPDCLIVAIPENQQPEITAKLEKRLPTLSPVPTLVLENATALQSRLDSRFPAEVVDEIQQILDQPARIYLIITLGGT